MAEGGRVSFYTFGAVLGGLGAILQVLGYALYIKSIVRNGVVPNVASWGLWSFGTLVTLLIYSEVTSDWSKLALPAACSACSLVIIAFAASRRQHVPIDFTDWLIIIADLLVVAVWVTTSNPIWSYAALLVDTSLTFLPMIRAVANRHTHEEPSPWIVWTAAYTCMLLATFVRWEGVYPMLLPLLLVSLHAVMVLLSFRPMPAVNAKDTRD